MRIEALRQRRRDGRLPPWLRVRLPGAGAFSEVRETIRGHRLHTVCEEARCPNIAECWGGGTATIMILGDVCTRACRFCHVKSGNPGGQVDEGEPESVGQAIGEMQLRYVVLTSVDRDDLADGGAEHFAACVRAIRANSPQTLIETLIPDFRGDEAALGSLLDAGPDVLAQNQETIRRLTRAVRDVRASYDVTLSVLAAAKRRRPKILTKSSLMVGLGETEAELIESMRDLRAVGVDLLTIGQYLQPSPAHLPVVEYVAPDRFDRYREMGESLGFGFVASGPLVRSSYRAGEYFLEAQLRGQP